MAFLWGFLMYFICHTIANIFANHAFFLFISIKCNWKNNVAQKRYIVIILFCVFAYALILAIALLVEPFSSYKGAILIGNGIGFITGSIHFMMMSGKNCQKQEEKYCINEDEERVKPPVKETKVIQSHPQSVNIIKVNGNRDDGNVSANIDSNYFLPEGTYLLKLFVKPEILPNKLKEIKVIVKHGTISRYVKAEKCIYISVGDSETEKKFYDAINRTFIQAIREEYILLSIARIEKRDKQNGDSGLLDKTKNKYGFVENNEDDLSLLLKLAYKVDNYNDDYDDDVVNNMNCDFVDIFDNMVNNIENKKFMMSHIMNEEDFAKSQKELPGFMPDFTYNKQKIEELKLKKQKYGNLLADEASKLIFPLIFGCFDYEIDLDEALNQTQLLYEDVIKRKPKDFFVRESEPYMVWLREYAIPQILFGTIYAYKTEYAKASYHFMLGLKTEQIAINMPYCDFIRYILNKLPALATGEADYTGCGFSWFDPMGTYSGTMLNAKLAMAVIPEMEGCNGEVIVARMGNSGMFGYLDRLGSTHGKKQPYPIDVYETYVIDKEYDVRKLRLYFYGYVNPDEKNIIKVADGFKIKSHSVLLNQFNFVTET